MSAITPIPSETQGLCARFASKAANCVKYIGSAIKSPPYNQLSFLTQLFSVRNIYPLI